ncbi:MAG: hypothetical protein K2P14_06070 [Anaeroplasmataceae bacterium]|nr:hypothetical protein [Anaeroplasmataceae bacterium]
MVNRFKKAVFFGAVVVTLIAGIPMETNAATRDLLYSGLSIRDEVGISTHMMLISDSHVSLTMSKDGKVTVSASVTGSSSTTRCKIVATLQKSENGTWNKVKSWKKSNDFKSVRISKTYTVSKGTYRISAKVTVYSKSGSETKTIMSGCKSY